MSFFKKISSAVDPEISKFTKILQNERSPILSQIGPKGSGQGFFHGLGFSSAGNALSPEATLASILKEWNKLKTWPLDTQLSVIESRIFGSKYVHPDDIKTLQDWLIWRMNLEFPSHGMNASNGWTRDFYEWSIKRSEDFF